jgi:hypothetical protein
MLLVLIVTVIVLGSLLRRVPGSAAMPEAPPVELPPLTAHALEHPDSRLAWDHVRRNGAYCRYDCPDGRTRYVCGMPDHSWAVVVLSAADRLITAFTTDQEYARGIIDGCQNPWRFVHP